MNSESSASRTLRVAAVQMVSTARVEANLETAAGLIAEAAASGARLIALPEYFCLMGIKDTDKVAVREALGSGPIQDFLVAQARRHRIWLVGGTLPLEAPEKDRVLNTTLVFDPQGERVARYDKVHLFRFTRGMESYDEAATIAPGGAVSTFSLEPVGGPALKVGLSVCYDLRFPELYRAMERPDLILVPAAFTATTGRAHWEVLLRARAIENLAYVLAPAQGGRHENGRATFGHSMLIDPWGEVIANRPEGAGVVFGDIDPQVIARCRSSLPALTHRVM
ncbi:MAG TPA: carbon-nitrogen hydrolase family protein [Burkholderiaceae bacterium]|nr:carbon-nitrogen hydrolase family protein [Burkholderiaceae bacterium]